MIFIIFAVSFKLHAESGLGEYLLKAWGQSAVVKGEAFKREESEELVSSARGGYLPHVSIEALDTGGFAGSNSLLHVGGLMGSPFRKGAAGGVVVEQTVYDFGRISALLARAKAEKTLAEARLADEKWRFLTALGRIYLSCAQARTIQNYNERMLEWYRQIVKESAYFTSTGQKSIIDNQLSKTHVNDIEVRQDELRKVQQSAKKQLQMFAALDECRPLGESWNDAIDKSLTIEPPTLLMKKAEREISAAELDRARANQLPTLNVIASAGEMENARVVKKEEWSAGVGLVFPVWNGGEDQHRARALKSRLGFEEQALKNAQTEFASEISGLRDEVNRDRETLQAIEKNLEQVRETAKLASKRYHALQGPLIDLRESLRSMAEIEGQRARVLFQLASAALQVRLIAGAP